MKLKVLGSSSSGNCYILENDNEALILEAGIKLAEVKRALNFNLKKIVGCLLSHEHGDHSKYMNEFLNDAIPVWASEGTIHNTEIKGFRLPLILTAGHLLKIGNFQIIPFETKHDAAEPVGFFINHEETGNILFATDTYYLPNRFAGLNNILLECNYRMDILEKNMQNGRISVAQRNRTLQSHLSYETCLKTLLGNDLKAVNNIVLIHLSNDNSHEKDFVNGIQQETGKTTLAAKPGMIIEFNKTPF
jgi:phosphoribosyl 1,2-cyclic phosphodiesterase